MKIKSSGEELIIQPESDQEQKNLEQWETEAHRLMPKISAIWQTQLQTMTDLSSLIEMTRQGVCVFSLKKLVETGAGTPIIIDTRASERKAGRPLDTRTIQASLKLLLFAPYEIVLEQEKAWRTKKYLAEVRDKCVAKSIRKAKYRALRDADMCVARAQRLVAEFFEKHPELMVPYIVLCNLARDWKSASELKN